jgi:hypothetical protein
MEHVMKREYWKNALTAMVVASGLTLVSVTAQAQSVSFGSDINLNLGKDVKAAHASQGSVGIDGGNMKAGGAIADGVRIGDSKFQSGVKGAVSVPTASVAEFLGN